MISRGSEWRRWEPHIRAPGTVMNNQFTGPTAWEDYLSALEVAVPVIEAIAVTDYYVTETYQQVLKYKAAKRLRAATPIFPNVELRLDVARGQTTSCRATAISASWSATTRRSPMSGSTPFDRDSSTGARAR